MADIEMCSCPSTTVVRIHGKGSDCGDAQHERLAEELAGQESDNLDVRGDYDCWPSGASVVSAVSAVLDALRKEPAPAAVALRAELKWLRDKLTSMVDAATEYSWVRVADQMEAAAQPSSVDRRENMPAEIPANVVVLPEDWRHLTYYPIAGHRNPAHAADAVNALIESWRAYTSRVQPAAAPEPFEITDVAGDEVRVNSLPGAARISVAVEGVIWLDPDEADQLADALKAHAAARRAEHGRQA